MSPVNMAKYSEWRKLVRISVHSTLYDRYVVFIPCDHGDIYNFVPCVTFEVLMTFILRSRERSLLSALLEFLGRARHEHESTACSKSHAAPFRLKF